MLKNLKEAWGNIFAKDGIIDTTITGLAEAVGVNFGGKTFYEYLDDLVKEFFTLAIRALKDVIREEMPMLARLLFGSRKKELEERKEHDIEKKIEDLEKIKNELK